MPGTALGAGATPMNKTNKIHFSLVFTFYFGERDRKRAMMTNNMKINQAGQGNIKCLKLGGSYFV